MACIGFWTKMASPRYIVWATIITINRILARSFVPRPWLRLFVEPTSSCNLACRFCAYPLGLRPRQSMSGDLFARCMQGAAELGVEQLWMTPITGDVFMDKDVLNKLRLAESSSVKDISFYTNFVVPDAEGVKALRRTTKLRELHISLYGANQERFAAITQKSSRLFERLVLNLETLCDELRDWPNPPRIFLELREGVEFNLQQWDGALAKAVARLRSEHGASFGVTTEYDTWGGQVTEKSVEGLGITLLPGEVLFRRGVCYHVFRSPMVTASGAVIACGCRGYDPDLVLGDLRHSPLSEILSLRNPKLWSVVSNMNAGRFPKTCASCSVYRSTFDHRWSKAMDPLEVTTLENIVQLARSDIPAIEQRTTEMVASSAR
jgi:MoaA/NifB/PqqE/SkfB family radical SAM enzyme